VTPADRAALAAAASPDDADHLLRALHAKYHVRPLAHVAVHRAWMAVHRARGNYLRMLGHAFAGYVVAIPASLVQRYTGLVVPAFDASKRS